MFLVFSSRKPPPAPAPGGYVASSSSTIVCSILLVHILLPLLLLSDAVLAFAPPTSSGNGCGCDVFFGGVPSSIPAASAAVLARCCPPSSSSSSPPHLLHLSAIVKKTTTTATTITTNKNPTTSTTTALSATWSNGQAIKEYQDFLATGQSEPQKSDDGPSVIIAPQNHVDGTDISPLVNAIVAMGGEGEDLVLPPGHPLPPEMGGKAEYPIYIALPPWELEQFLNNVGNGAFDGYVSRVDDFVFFSGGPVCGAVEHVLKPRGYARDAMTQVLVGGLGMQQQPSPPRAPTDLSVNLGLDAQGEDKWCGECSACGKWNGAVSARFRRNGIRCRESFYREWRRSMWERACYDAIFNLVGSVREERTSLGQVALYYGDEVSDMLWQASMQLRGMLAVTLTYGFEERLFGFGEVRGQDVPCELVTSMYPFVYPDVLAECKDIAQYLNYAQSMGGAKLEGVVLPRVAAAGEKPSAMRQGNLRADGVL